MNKHQMDRNDNKNLSIDFFPKKIITRIQTQRISQCMIIDQRDTPAWLTLHMHDREVPLVHDLDAHSAHSVLHQVRIAHEGGLARVLVEDQQARGGREHRQHQAAFL